MGAVPLDLGRPLYSQLEAHDYILVMTGVMYLGAILAGIIVRALN